MVKISSLQDRIPGLSILEADQIDLWFQPVYQMPTGVVLHHEVFVRWRDRQGQFHLPETFFPSLARMGLLPWLDRQVIQKVIDRLVQEEFLSLSVNLSAASLNDRHLAAYIEDSLERSKIDPNRLHFEIPEKSAAYHFQAAIELIQSIQKLGCGVILDSFTAQDLTAEQCEALAVNMVKADGQILQILSSPTGEDLTEYLLEMRPVLGAIVVKFVEESATAEWAEQCGFNGVQGCYLNPPDSVPDSVALSSARSKTERQLEASTAVALLAPPDIAPPELMGEPAIAQRVAPAPLPKRLAIPWLRLVTATGFVGLASLALTIGLSSLSYHLLHVTVEGGLLNGRTVRLQSPIKGNVTEFYAQPGAVVRSGQVLARIQQGREEEAAILQLENEVQLKANQLTAAIQTQSTLQTQASSLASRSESVWSVAVETATVDVSGQQAALEGAIAQAKAARANRDRYQGLANEGAVSQQVAEQYQANLEVAEANVRQAQSALDAAQTTAAATESRTLMGENPGLGNGFVQEAAQLQQQIQTQVSLVRTLTAERDNAQQRLDKARSIYSARQDLAIAAPFTGVVYRTERERNELVDASAPLVTLLDCNDLWVEIVVSAKAASQYDLSKPVKVELGLAVPVMGEIILNQPLSSAQGGEEQFRLTRVQALQPVIPPELAGQALTRLTIRVPPPENQSQQFCGVGQLARLTFSKKWFSP
jgi:EAL domain-containing protein (putative c-di-GMP-specific phosphodiesterase class I)/multidrug resistance efflux pump